MSVLRFSIPCSLLLAPCSKLAKLSPGSGEFAGEDVTESGVTRRLLVADAVLLTEVFDVNDSVRH